MEINGIKIRDMKDVQDVLMALETIKLSIENLSDDMSNNYHNYSSLNEDISDSVVSQKELIEGISHLQIKGKELADYLQQLGSNIKIVNQKSINNLKEEFENFDYQIKNTLSNVVNDIDLSTFRKQVETLFSSKVSSLESEVRRLSKLNDDLSTLNDNLDKSIKTAKTKVKETFDYTKENIDDSLERFNSMAKVVNYKSIGFSFVGGCFVGFMALGVFGLDLLKDRMFKNEQMAINEYNQKKAELDSKYSNASELEKKARDFDIKFTTDKDGNRYIIMPNKYVEKQYISDTNWQVWKLY